MNSKGVSNITFLILFLVIIYSATLGSSQEQNVSPPPNCPNLTACLALADDLVTVVVGPTSPPCCPLIDGLADLDVVLCLCTTIKAGILNVDIDINIIVKVILNSCGRNIPVDRVCPS